jgi:methionyl-tRNA formyltransferase
MRLVFLGSPPEAVPALRALHEAGHEIPLVVTQPDRRRGRGNELVPTPVKAAATELGLPVLTPERARDVVGEIAASGADAGVVVAFGQLLPPAVLDAVPLGFVNVHFSLLPRWRGAAPVERAILAGDTETGVCIMGIEEGLDTGPVFACERTPLTDDETAGDVRARLAGMGTNLLLDVVPRLRDAAPEPQVGEPTYADKLTVDEFRLDPTRPAAELARLVRAGNPHPGAWMMVGGKRVKVLRARAASGVAGPGVLTRAGELATRDGLLVLDEVQPEGKRAMAGDAWLAGMRADRLSVDS